MRISDWSSDVCNTSAIDLSVLHIDDRNFAEASFTTIRGNLQGLVTGVLGDDGSYGALATGTMTVKDVRFTLRSEEHTSELQSLMRISYAVFCLKKKKTTN